MIIQTMKLLYRYTEKSYPTHLTCTIHQTNNNHYEVKINGKSHQPAIHTTTIKNAKFYLKDQLEKKRQKGARFKVIQAWE